MRTRTSYLFELLAPVLGAAISLAIAVSLAPQVPLAAGDPFAEGTMKKTLSAEERDVLRQFADTSRSRLERAKEKAAGKDLPTMGKLYFDAVKRVVIDSYALRGRPETLMRIALNQAMELTYGLPNADGPGTREPGILVGSSNQDLLTIILADSIALALRYYQSDVEAIDSGSLLDLPYADLAFRRLTLARKWLAAVLETTRGARFAREALQQWLDTMLIEEDSHQERFAAEILRAQEALDLVSASRSEELRRLRGEMKKLQAELTKKLGVGASAIVRGFHPSPARISNDTLLEYVEAVSREQEFEIVNNALQAYALKNGPVLFPGQIFTLISRLKDAARSSDEDHSYDDDETAERILEDQISNYSNAWSVDEVTRIPSTQVTALAANELIAKYFDSEGATYLTQREFGILIGALVDAPRSSDEDHKFDDDETAARMTRNWSKR